MAVNEKYYKRKKQKKIAWIVFGATLTGCVSLSILAFLGRYSGNFTIQMAQESKTQFTLYTQYNAATGGSADPTDATSYLKAVGLQNAMAITADSLPADDDVDNAIGGAKNGTRSIVDANNNTFTKDTYLGFTFFVQNISGIKASFDVQMNAQFTLPSNDAPSLEDIIRVRVFENLVNADGTLSHGMATYAYSTKNPTTSSDGTVDHREKITGDFVPAKAENQGYAKEFYSDTTVFSSTYLDLTSLSSVRYTVLIWIEGNDPDCKGAQPQDASLTFSMGFQAHN